MPPVRLARPTRADVILALIRADVLQGHLGPGAKLGFSDLGQRYGASTGVLREVLPRLVEQGLAQSEAQLGFRVIEVSIGRLAELTEARVAVETLVTRLAVARGTIAWESRVVAKHHALARTGDLAEGEVISEAWMTAHEEFHAAILTGADNPYLAEAALRLRSISEVYRCWSRPEHDRAHRDVAQEHRDIMEAAVARDVEGAAQLTEAHITRTTDLLVAGLEAGRVATARSPG